jgi:hypothetical protein
VATERAIMMSPRCSRAAAFILFALLSMPAALAQSGLQSGNWTERLYNPPVGSKWQIVSETDTVENRPGAGNREQRIRMHADLSIDEKLPGGFFRVTYTTRNIAVTGNTPAVKLVGDAYSAISNIPIHGRLDSAGRPVEIENLAEVKTTMNGIVDKLAAKFESNPKMAAFMREVLKSLLVAEGREAATLYLEELPELAAVQNIGLRPGAVRQDTESTPSPIGGLTIKTVMTTRLDDYDEKTGAARFVRKREFEKEALREAVIEIVRRLAAANDNKTITPEVLETLKKVNFSIEGETIYNVDNGMTVWVDSREFTTASVMGTTFTKQQKKTVALTRQN